jgi:hypothetical protein
MAPENAPMVLRTLFVAAVLGLGPAGPGALLAAPAPAPSSSAAQGALGEALQLDAMVDVLREEGLADAEGMAPGGEAGARRWRATVAAIYDRDRMRRTLDEVLAARMAPAPQERAAAIAFFTSATGVRVLQLEVAARRSLLDPDTEAAARFRWEDMVAAQDPRVSQLLALAEAADLVEANVAGSLNASLAFYLGIAEAGGPLAGLAEEDILSMVSADEARTRAQTEGWLFPYMTLAYAPLSAEELARFTEFSASPAGRRLNAVMFAAYERLFTAISHDLGLAAGRELAGQDI